MTIRWCFRKCLVIFSNFLRINENFELRRKITGKSVKQNVTSSDRRFSILRLFKSLAANVDRIGKTAQV